MQPFDSFTRLLNLWPLKIPRNSPCGIEGRLLFSLCPFPDESAVVNQSWCQSVQPFDRFPRLFLIIDPLKPPKCRPCVLTGNLFSVYSFPDESAHVCQIWCQSVQLFDSFTRLLNLWPLKIPRNSPCGIEGRLVFCLCPFPDNNNGRNGSCLTWLATSLEEKRRWLIINASPWGKCSQ